MTVSLLLAQYGYLAVFIGCLLEGETILLLAGFAAHQGYLSLPRVMALACVAGALGDVIFYGLGRRYGEALLARFPAWAPRVARVHALIERHHGWLIVTVRFMYGLRIVGPIVIGTSRVSAGRFVALNFVGAVLWAALVAGGGYLFGHAMALVIDDMHHYEMVALVGLIAAMAGLAGWRARRMRRKEG